MQNFDELPPELQKKIEADKIRTRITNNVSVELEQFCEKIKSARFWRETANMGLRAHESDFQFDALCQIEDLHRLVRDLQCDQFLEGIFDLVKILIAMHANADCYSTLPRSTKK